MPARNKNCSRMLTFYTRKSDQKTEATANCDQCRFMPDYQSRVVEQIDTIIKTIKANVVRGHRVAIV